MSKFLERERRKGGAREEGGAESEGRMVGELKC